MCGISGFTYDDEKLVRRMMRVQAHRGPDQDGVYTDSLVSLGHNRLSILDLTERGKQPMVSSDGNLIIVFNGEIYNFQEIKILLEKKGYRFNSTSDTEVILYAYDAWGTACLSWFNGAFAFVLYDRLKKQLFCARDRMGKKPFYYYVDPKSGNFHFASEMKGLLEIGMPRIIDEKSLAAFLTLRYNPYTNTILQGIHKLPPGHYAIVKLGKKTNHAINFNCYWSIPFTENSYNGTVTEGIQHLNKLFEDATRLRLISDVPVGVYLSGGLDSSAVAGMMRKVMGPEGRLQTYSVGFNEDTDELGFARAVSDSLEAEHTELMIGLDSIKHYPKIVWHTDESIADPAMIPVYLLSQRAKKTSTVILSGDGADEMFAGYEHYKYLNFANTLNRIIPARVLGFGVYAATHALPKIILNKLFKYANAIGEKGQMRACDLFTHIQNKPQAYLDFVSIFTPEEVKLLSPTLPIQALPSYFSAYFCRDEPLLTQLLRLECENLLIEGYLMKNDKMTLAHGIEGRMPFLDHRIVEFAFSIPQSWKLHGMTEKWIVREAMKPVLPKIIYQRKKQRFYVPIDRWISRDRQIQNFISDHLLESGLSTDFVTKIFDNYQKAPLYYGRQAWSIFTYLIWREIYLHGKKPEKIL